MTKRSVDAVDGSVVQPLQSIVNSVRETVSMAVSGMAGFMKEPSDTRSRRMEPAARKTTSRKPAVARTRARRRR